MYVDEGFPAVADHFLVRALIDAAADLGPSRGFGTHIGINVSSDGFYAETPEWVERMIKHKIMNVEMESSAIFTIAHLRGAKAAMVCACSYNFTASDEVDYEGINEPLIVGWHKRDRRGARRNTATRGTEESRVNHTVQATSWGGQLRGRVASAWRVSAMQLVSFSA